MPTNNCSNRLRALLLLSAITAVPLGACGPDGGGDLGVCQSTILVGDLVITEVMANPAGEDGGQEWFEIFNASTAAIDLDGLTLEYSKVDGSERKTHVMSELVIEPGAYLVVGGVTPDLKPAWVDYGFGNDLGSFLNGGARLALSCGDDVVDEAEYPSAEGASGQSLGIDGNVAPSHVANDDPANYCPASQEFAPGMFGSPRESNEPCNIVVPGECNDNGTMRATVSPVVGDLVISEFLADADGADDGKEWFEVYVATTVDLNGVVAGLVAGSPKLSIDSPDCVRAEVGSYLLFAAEADEGLNGGLTNVDQTFNFTLKNGTTMAGPASLFIGIGETVLDEVVYETSESSFSTALDPGMLTPTANDDAANWITCEPPYGDETNHGTPRAANDTCSLQGMCRDGETFREVDPPGEDEIQVTEVLANPNGTDGPHEWFEIAALGTFDLNGLQYGKDGALTHTLSPVDCVAAGAGDFFVVAKSLEPATNGDLPQADFLLGTLTLNNDADSSVVVGVGDQILHTFAYGTSSEGFSRQLDGDGTTCSSPETSPYDGDLTMCGADDGEGNCGTPGATNPDCP